MSEDSTSPSLAQQVVARCATAMALLTEVTEFLLRTADLADEAGHLLRFAGQGSSRPDFEWAAQHLLAAGPRIEDLLRCGQAGRAAVERWLHNSLGMTLEGAPVHAPPPLPPSTPPHLAPPDVPPVSGAPLSDYFEEHVFTGHLSRRPTGYHSRPGGRDQPDRELTSVDPPDHNGVYRASYRARTGTGRWKTKPESTFFPDDWSPADVRRAVRTAFANRRPATNRHGDVLAHKWEGNCGTMRIQGFIRTGVDFTTATFTDIMSAWPVAETPERS